MTQSIELCVDGVGRWNGTCHLLLWIGSRSERFSGDLHCEAGGIQRLLECRDDDADGDHLCAVTWQERDHTRTERATECRHGSIALCTHEVHEPCGSEDVEDHLAGELCDEENQVLLAELLLTTEL